MFTTSLRSLIAKRMIEAARLQRQPRADLSRIGLMQTQLLTTEQEGTAYPVFVLSAHDPDDSTDRWVA